MEFTKLTDKNYSRCNGFEKEIKVSKKGEKNGR